MIAYGEVLLADPIAEYTESYSIEISHSEFVENGAAIEATQASSLPCVPPWNLTIYVNESWFSPGGYPTPSIEIASVAGADIPWYIGPILPEYGFAIGLNTIPFAIYECDATDPPILPFPVTPVYFGSVVEDPLDH